MPSGTATEKKNGPATNGVFKEMPPRLPALLFAEAVVKQIEKKALPATDVVDQPAVEGRAAGLNAERAGREFFELAAACRRAGIDPVQALKSTYEIVKELRDES